MQNFRCLKGALRRFFDFPDSRRLEGLIVVFQVQSQLAAAGPRRRGDGSRQTGKDIA